MRLLLASLAVCLAVEAHAQTTDPGPAFDDLERESVRVVTWFADSYAITDRRPDQGFSTRLFDRLSTRVLATADYRGGEQEPVARLRARVGGATVAIDQAAAPRRTAAWSNRQLRQLWLDHRAGGAGGPLSSSDFVTHADVWRTRHALRAAGGPGPVRHDEDDREVEGVAVEYPDATAVTLRDEDVAPLGRRVARVTFTTRMLDAAGGDVGVMRWFARERVLTWEFPNGRRGVAMESKVPGGFGFTPTLAWAGVQARGFLRQSARPAVRVPLAPQRVEAAPVSLDPLALRGPRVPEPAQQEGCDGEADGCTGLHFLDGSIFEECCTRHDLCYERDSPCCEAWSWFLPNPFWHCARCNFKAVWCFLTRPGGQWWDDGPLGECERRTVLDWCPPECATCTTRDDRGREH